MAYASQKPLLTFSLKSEDSFTVEGSNQISIYGLSERMGPAIRENTKRNIEAADLSVGPLIRTKDPKVAAQKLLSQISTQSGLRLQSRQDSVFAANVSPAVIWMAVSKKSVWHIILVPESDGLYRLGITSVIDQ